MPAFSGTFEYSDERGSVAHDGPCRVEFDDCTISIVSPPAPPLAFDLGDIDVLTAGDYDLSLALYTGRRITLAQFGKSFQNLVHDLVAAWRDRLVACLLLGDLPEIARFEGGVRLEGPAGPLAAAAEIRLYETNIAVLPLDAAAFQWRLADVDACAFDEAAYGVRLEANGRRLLVSKLAKRTGEFRERVEEALRVLDAKSARLLHDVLPYLTPDQLGSVSRLMREGRSAGVAALASIDRRIERTVVDNIVDARLRPYFDRLATRAGQGEVRVGFKLIRPEGEEDAGEGAEMDAAEDAAAPPLEAAEGAAPPAAQGTPVLVWFFFPLATAPGARPSLLAWEATSRAGRATYFFRLGPRADAGAGGSDIDAAVDRITRALVALNFRRAPIYLPDDRLQANPAYRRYAIAARKLAEVRDLRAAFAGRAIHTSLDAWQKQVDQILADRT